MESANPVCVLSVGRSGTSLATHALQRLGIYLGEPADLMPANEQNLLGFWEHQGIYEINEAVLSAFGGSWYRPPVLHAGWERDERISELRERARVLIEELTSHGRWGFKDPRVAATLPFWEALAGPFDFVICVRYPRAVISSISATGYPGNEPTASASLWLAMNAAILRHTVKARRHFVFYEDWFRAPDRVFGELAGFLGVKQPAAGVAREIFDPAQRRADVGTDAGAVSGTEPELAAMWTLMRLASGAPSEAGGVDRALELQIAEQLCSAFGLRFSESAQS